MDVDRIPHSHSVALLLKLKDPYLSGVLAVLRVARAGSIDKVDAFTGFTGLFFGFG